MRDDNESPMLARQYGNLITVGKRIHIGESCEKIDRGEL